MRIIAGEARGRIIEAPSGRHTRPTLDRVRANIFNMIQSDIPGSDVLDLFAGSGALSLEALSRGAHSAVLVDSDRSAWAVQKKNIELLHYSDRTKQFLCDWRKAIRQLKQEQKLFDVVFLDPPYHMQDLYEVFTALDSVTDIHALIVLEHQSESIITVPEKYELTKSRTWGYCAVSLYRINIQGGFDK